jgi:hypothetical protein
MSISRRDFMKLVGVSVASLALTRCRLPIGVTCYAPLPPSPTPTEPPLTAKDHLRLDWLSFGELAQATIEEASQGSTDNAFGQNLVAEHRLALDELVAGGELTPTVADLIQEAYDAAVYHVWRSNIPMTCYVPMIVNYAPVSAGVLVQQAEVLSEVVNESTIDPETLAKAQAALQHDMAFYALTDEEIASLYDRLITEWQSQQQTVPSFEDVELEITPDAKAAAQFIISLLTSK